MIGFSRVAAAALFFPPIQAMSVHAIRFYLTNRLYRGGIVLEHAVTRGDEKITRTCIGCGDSWDDVQLDQNDCCYCCAEFFCENCGCVDITTRVVEDRDETGPGTTIGMRCWNCSPPSRTEVEAAA